MIDNAQILMGQGNLISSERATGTNDNMTFFHSHEYFEIYYLEEGARYHMIEGKIFTLSVGHLAIFKPNQLHYSFGGKDIFFSRVLVYFDENVVENRAIVNKLNEIAGVYQLSVENSTVVHNLIKEIIAEETAKNQFYFDNMASLVNQLSVYLIRNTSNKMANYKKTIASKITAYIDNNYMNKITIDDISEHFYISKWHLCREFKNATNETIIQYTNKVRISEAQKLLLHSDKSITTIGAEVGFETITHFERVFKQTIGLTPTKYRNHNI